MGDPKSYFPDRLLGEEENYDDDSGCYGPARITCRNCRTRNLHWEVLDSGKWRLFDESRRLHECKKKPLAD